MIQKLSIALIFTSLLCTAQNKVTFTYDNAGNQTHRTLCINCQPINANTEIREFIVENEISYYPNPVREQLYLTWKVAENNKVKYIQVFNITGQTLKYFIRGNTSENSQNISFSNYPTGIYIINFTYQDGQQKSIKVIKK